LDGMENDSMDYFVTVDCIELTLNFQKSRWINQYVSFFLKKEV
jgi:hypothetical protein